jgi:hypothetical protein
LRRGNFSAVCPTLTPALSQREREKGRPAALSICSLSLEG